MNQPRVGSKSNTHAKKEDARRPGTRQFTPCPNAKAFPVSPLDVLSGLVSEVWNSDTVAAISKAVEHTASSFHSITCTRKRHTLFTRGTENRLNRTGSARSCSSPECMKTNVFAWTGPIRGRARVCRRVQLAPFYFVRSLRTTCGRILHIAVGFGMKMCCRRTI